MPGPTIDHTEVAANKPRHRFVVRSRPNLESTYYGVLELDRTIVGRTIFERQLRQDRLAVQRGRSICEMCQQVGGKLFNAFLCACRRGKGRPARLAALEFRFLGFFEAVGDVL